MKIISTEELKVLQLEILTALDRFCKEEGIKYFIIDGTLLGAVRHKGYIPWDDDIDVGLVRSEYNRLMAEFPDVLEGRYELLSLERNNLWDRSYAAIYDNKTVVKYEHNSSMATGLLIDIFPVDEVPSEPSKWLSCIRSMKLYNRLLSFKSNALPPFTSNPVKWAGLGLIKLLLFPFSQRKISIWKSHFAQSFNGCQSGLGYVMAFGISSRERYLLKDFESLEEYPFEGRKFIGPKNYDSVLTRTYGDYMQLPPVEQRVTHHSLTAYYK